MTPGVLDTLIGWLLGILATSVAALVGWGFTLDRRVGRLETMGEASADNFKRLERKLDALDEKFDKLIDKLLRQ